MKKRFLSLFLVLCMLITCVPTVWADNEGTSNVATAPQTGLAYRLVDKDTNGNWVPRDTYFDQNTPVSHKFGNSSCLEIYLNGTKITDEDEIKKLVDAGKGLDFFVTPDKDGNKTTFFSFECTDPKGGVLLDETSGTKIEFTPFKPNYGFYDNATCEFDASTNTKKLNATGEYSFWFSKYEDGIAFTLVDDEANPVDASIATVKKVAVDNDVMLVTVTIKQMPDDEICLRAMKNKNDVAEVALIPKGGNAPAVDISGFYYRAVTKNGTSYEVTGEPKTIFDLSVDGSDAYIALYFGDELIKDLGSLKLSNNIDLEKIRRFPGYYAVSFYAVDDIIRGGRIECYDKDNNEQGFIVINPAKPRHGFYSVESCRVTSYISTYALTEQSETIYFSKDTKADIVFSCSVDDAIEITLGDVTADDMRPVTVTVEDANQFVGQTVYLQAKRGDEIIAAVELYAAPQGLSWREVKRSRYDDNDDYYYELGAYRTDPCTFFYHDNEFVAVYYTNASGQSTSLTSEELIFSEGLEANPLDNNAELLEIWMDGAALGTISYQVADETYSLQVAAKPREYGFYRAEEQTAETYISRFEMSKNDDYTVYFDNVNDDDEAVEVNFVIEGVSKDILSIVEEKTSNTCVTLRMNKIAAWPVEAENVSLVAYDDEEDELESLRLIVDNGDMDAGDAEGLIFWLQEDLDSPNYIAGFAKFFTRENAAFKVPEFFTKARSTGKWDDEDNEQWDSFYFTVAENDKDLPQTVWEVYKDYFDLKKMSYKVTASEDSSLVPNHEIIRADGEWDEIQLCTKREQLGTTWKVVVTVPLQQPIYVLDGSSLKEIKDSFEWSMTFSRHEAAQPAVVDLKDMPHEQSTYDLVLSYIEKLQTWEGYKELAKEYPALEQSNELEIRWSGSPKVPYIGDIVIDGADGLLADVTLVGWDGEVRIQGSVRANVQNKNSCGLVLENLNFIGAGKDDQGNYKLYSDENETLYNYGISGRGEVRYEKCTFEGFYVAIYDDFDNIGGTGRRNTHFGANRAVFLNNHIAVYMNAANVDRSAGRKVFNECRFEGNDCAVWIKSLHENGRAYEYGVDNCQFIDNGMDIVYEDDKMLFFPCNFFGETDANGTIQCVQPKVDATWNNGIVMFAAEAAETELMLSVYPIFDSVDMKNLIVDAATTSFVMQNDTASSMAFVIEEREQDLTIEMVQQGESDGYTTLGSWNIAAKE